MGLSFAAWQPVMLLVFLSEFHRRSRLSSALLQQTLVHFLIRRDVIRVAVIIVNRRDVMLLLPSPSSSVTPISILSLLTIT